MERTINGTLELQFRDVVLGIAGEELEPVLALAASITGHPVALVTFLDGSRQRFLARRGTDATEASADQAFCQTVVETGQPLVVPDGTRDARFARNVFVADWGFRSYAGVPLVVNGAAIGALCVLDRRPRRAHAIVPRLEELACLAGNVLERAMLAHEYSEMKHEISVREARFRQIEASARLGGFRLDLKDGSIRWTEQVYHNVGMEPGTPLDSATVLACYAPEDQAEMRMRLQAARDGIAIPVNKPYKIITPQGEERWLHVVSDVEMVAGEARSLFGIVQDVSERYRYEKSLEVAAHTDSLTGLGNMRQFCLDLARYHEKAAADLGMLLLDGDSFKMINDAHGHLTGDLILQELARRIAAVVGDAGRAYRLGGDEFAVLIPGLGRPDDLGDLAQRVLDRCQAILKAGSISLIPRLSAGGAVLEDGTDVDTFRQSADFALYHAKEQRRGGYVEFDKTLRTRIMKRIGSVQMLEKAIYERKLIAHYQPVIAASGTLQGFEALVRLVGATGEIVPAAAFHEALRDSNLSHQVTSLMIEMVASSFGAWRRLYGASPYVGINVGTSDFARGDLAERLTGSFERHGVALDMLVLEVTETVFLEGVQHEIDRSLRDLRDRGVRVALDDFGTGYASLSHLNRLPIDIVKVDKSFIDNIASETSSYAIVEAMTRLAHRLDMRVIAEGVETEDQMRILLDLGCDAFQGYLFGRPMGQEAYDPNFGKRFHGPAGDRSPSRANAAITPATRVV